MPGFCRNCGAPLAGAFCGKCGQPAQAPSAQTQTPNVPAQTPRAPTQSTSAPAQPQATVAGQAGAQASGAAKKGSSLGKVLLIVGLVFVVFVGLGIAGIFYGVHLVKNKISQATGGAIGGTPEQVKVAQGNSCALLSKEDLQQTLGIAIEKSQEIMEGSEPGCAYYTNPAAFTQLQQMAVEQAKKDSEEASKKMQGKTDNPLELMKHTKEMEGMIKALALTQPDKEGRVFSFTVQRNFGSNNWSTVRATISAVPGFDDVQGVGDRAMIGSFGHALYVLKGDSVIHLDLTYVPNAQTRGTEIGRIIASHL